MNIKGENIRIITNIHSVVDLITNSSTVIYTEAHEGTIKTVKEIINLILKLGGNKTLTADDLFTFSLNEECGCEPNDCWCGYPTINLVMTPKEGITAPKNLGIKLDTMFTRKAEYNG